MGRRGPKPEPAAVKEAKGNPSKRPIGSDPEPVADAETEAPKKAAAPVVTPPTWLKDEGLEIWQRLAPNLTALKLLAQTDADAFARYCRSFARWLEMNQRIDKEGLTVHIESKHGEWDRPHPLVLPADRLEVRLQAFEDRFGLNPSERQRIFAGRAQRPATGDLPLPQDAHPSSRPSAPAGGSSVGLLN